MLGAHQIPAWLERLDANLPEQVTDPEWEAPLRRAAFVGTIRTQLLPYITCGPQARRSVDDHMRQAIFEYRRGHGSEALFWLGRAVSAAMR
jgi:hypothetical protein